MGMTLFNLSMSGYTPLSKDRLMRDIGPRLITAKREIESQLSIGKLLQNERY